LIWKHGRLTLRLEAAVGLERALEIARSVRMMPFQNRVTPLVELIATPERGLVYGNRGRLHDERGVIRREWQVKRWITCRLEFRGRHRVGGPMAPNRYTGLFFLDEATALAAGHRPCAECRNADYKSFLALTGASSAGELDEMLHAERGRRLHESGLDDLPDGAFVVARRPTVDRPRFGPLALDTGGYSERRPRFSGRVELVTPPRASTSSRRAGQEVSPHPPESTELAEACGRTRGRLCSPDEDLQPQQ
jgi:hypothetical protein